jgi:magnesium transporter
MSEFDPNNYKHQFEEIISTSDSNRLCEFLDQQNISDVAELIFDHPEHESLIISCMSVHRAASVFKILDLSNQKNIIRQLPPHKTAALLNALPPDDRTDFLEELPSNVVRELIKLLNTEERKIALSLLG